MKSGDLVMVVRGHDCTVNQLGGVPYKVEDVGQSGNGQWHCSVCNEWNINAGPRWAMIGAGKIPIAWLKKIEPGTDDESIVRELEVA